MTFPLSCKEILPHSLSCSGRDMCSLNPSWWCFCVMLLSLIGTSQYHARPIDQNLTQQIVVLSYIPCQHQALVNRAICSLLSRRSCSSLAHHKYTLMMLAVTVTSYTGVKLNEIRFESMYTLARGCQSIAVNAYRGSPHSSPRGLPKVFAMPKHKILFTAYVHKSHSQPIPHIP